MPRPAQLPTFATDATYSSGPESGLATKVAYTSGELAQGHRPASAPAAPKLNWWKNLVGQWVTWLGDFFDDDGLIAKVVRLNTYAFLRAAGTLPVPHTCFTGGTLQATYVDGFTAAEAWIAIRPGHKITSLEFDFQTPGTFVDGLSFFAYAFSHAAPTGAAIGIDDAGTSSAVEATKTISIGGGGWTAPSYPCLVQLLVTCSTPATELPRLYRARVVTAAA